MDRRTLQNAVRNVLDGELLNRYLYLSTMERSELAKKIGTTPDIVSARPRSAPAPPCRSPPTHRLSPADPGRLAGDGPRHRPLLAPWMPLPPAPPHYLPPPFLYKTQGKIFLFERTVCGHYTASWPSCGHSPPVQVPTGLGASTPPAQPPPSAQGVKGPAGPRRLPWSSGRAP